MATVGVINLGLSDAELAKFLSLLKETPHKDHREFWSQDTPAFNYKRLDPTSIAASCDVLVLSHGTARVGLPNAERARRDPDIPVLYTLIHNAVDEGVPLIGVNAGHEALNCAYGWAIDKIPDELRDKYHEEHRLSIDEIAAGKDVDPILAHVGTVQVSLTNSYVVLPRDKQRKRFGQNRVQQIAHFMGYPLVSRVDSEAPVYGVQFNLEPTTQPVFRNFFDLAKKYLESK